MDRGDQLDVDVTGLVMEQVAERFFSFSTLCSFVQRQLFIYF